MKNANIKSKGEARNRIRAGEIFYFYKTRIFYDEEELYDGNSPYRFGDYSMRSIWDKFAEFEIKTEWYDEVSVDNPVLCRVWSLHDTDPERERFALVDNYDAEIKTFFSRGRSITKAEPVIPDSKYIYRGE